MEISISSVRANEVINRQYYVDQRNIQQAKLTNLFEKGMYNSRSGRVQAIQYWIDYWKGWIEISDIKLKLLDGR